MTNDQEYPTDPILRGHQLAFDNFTGVLDDLGDGARDDIRDHLDSEGWYDLPEEEKDEEWVNSLLTAYRAAMDKLLEGCVIPTNIEQWMTQ